MDRTFFEGQMKRLASAYRVEIKAPTMSAYWMAFQKTPDSKFSAACEKAIEHETTFPSIAHLKEILRVRNEVAPSDVPLIDESAEERMMRQGRENAARLRHAGILSDQWPGARIVHAPGTPMHALIIYTYDQLIALLERTIDRRDAEYKAEPGNAELGRRVGVLVETHSAAVRRLDHFEATGETL